MTKAFALVIFFLLLYRILCQKAAWGRMGFFWLTVPYSSTERERVDHSEKGMAAGTWGLARQSGSRDITVDLQTGSRKKGQELRTRNTNWKAYGRWYVSSSKIPSPKGSIIFPNSYTNWGPSARINELLGTFLIQTTTDLFPKCGKGSHNLTVWKWNNWKTGKRVEQLCYQRNCKCKSTESAPGMQIKAMLRNLCTSTNMAEMKNMQTILSAGEDTLLGHPSITGGDANGGTTVENRQLFINLNMHSLFSLAG